MLNDCLLYTSKEAFIKLHDFLVSGEDLGREFTMGMAGFILENTLSNNGAVTRGCLLYTSYWETLCYWS